MAKEKVSLILPYEFENLFSQLPLEQAGKLIIAIYAYERRGEEPDFSTNPILGFTWNAIIKQVIDRNVMKYKEVCEKRRKAGAKGGDAKAQNVANAKNATTDVANAANAKNATTDEANAHDNDSDYDNDCGSDNDCDCDKNHPSNLQTLSCNRIGGSEQKPVDNSGRGKTENVEQCFGESPPESLDGWNLEKSREEDVYSLSSHDACNTYRESYLRKQGTLRDLQVAWVQATEVKHVLPGDLILAARKYSKECKEKGIDMQYVKMPQNFISSGMWKLYIPKFLPSCPYCHGKGIYDRENGMKTQCNCDRRYG